MAKDLQVHVGESIETFAPRFIDAWRRAERGDLTAVNSERHLSFESFSTFVSVMTPKRLALLRHLHRVPAPSIRALAGALGRDYRRVHDDVEALTRAGLIERGPEGLRADYETLRIDTTVAM